MLAVADLAPLFTLLALAGFAVAIWLAYTGQYIAALVAAVVAVLILLYG